MIGVYNMGLFNDIIKSSKADAGDLSKAAQHCFADLGMHVDVSALSTEENKQARQRINDKAENATGVCATLGGVAGSIIGGAFRAIPHSFNSLVNTLAYSSASFYSLVS